MNEISVDNDPGRWGASLINMRELLLGCLDARGARSVLEVGAYEGGLTRVLLTWAEAHDATVTAIDPTPPERLLELESANPKLDLVRETSHEALARLELPDAIVIDGDHNYYTLSNELRLIGERVGDGELPLLLFHDVGWPHARRDSYYAPERIPDAERQPLVERGGIAPEDPGLVEGGLPLPYVAVREGGERNGVLTAIEDFVDTRGAVRVVTVPIFFGFGAAFDPRASWAPNVAEILDPWDRNPILARLEQNRTYHLAFGHQLYTKVMGLSHELELERAELERARGLIAEQRALLGELVDSGSLAVAEQLSRLRGSGQATISRERIRAVLARDRQD